MELLPYSMNEPPSTDSDVEHRVQQLVVIAKELASEIETLQSELGPDGIRDKQIDFDDGIDFYREVEQYEIELITSALDQCNGNQTHAAKLLSMKPTTLNAKVKHYGLNTLRPIINPAADERGFTSDDSARGR